MVIHQRDHAIVAFHQCSAALDPVAAVVVRDAAESRTVALGSLSSCECLMRSRVARMTLVSVCDCARSYSPHR